MKDLLAETAARSVRYSAAAGNMRVAPQPRNVARLEALGGALPQNPSDPAEVLALLDDVGSPGQREAGHRRARIRAAAHMLRYAQQIVWFRRGLCRPCWVITC